MCVHLPQEYYSLGHQSPKSCENFGDDTLNGSMISQRSSRQFRGKYILFVTLCTDLIYNLRIFFISSFINFETRK